MLLNKLLALKSIKQTGAVHKWTAEGIKIRTVSQVSYLFTSIWSGINIFYPQ